MLKHNLGYPRIGMDRELKKAIEQYWEEKIREEQLFQSAKELRKQHWILQSELDGIPCNDFSFYDHVLDMSFLLGAIPERYSPLISLISPIDLYFSMARGYQKNGFDVPAMEMTKWFDTNYHYIVPEFLPNQTFNLHGTKIFEEFNEAKEILGKVPKPVLIGPVSFLLLGKEKREGFHRIDLLDRLIPVYIEIFKRLKEQGADWLQLDEPFLVMDLSEKEKHAFLKAYEHLTEEDSGLKILLTTYFEGLYENRSIALKLPVSALHIDLVRCPNQLDGILYSFPKDRLLSLGVIDGRNIWKNKYSVSLEHIKKAANALGKERLMIAPSCSLIHVPFDLNLETDIHPEIKDRMAFARQKIHEITDLCCIFEGNTLLIKENRKSHKRSVDSTITHDSGVKKRLASTKEQDFKRNSTFESRRPIQRECLQLPLFPTTTIGSFPQTSEIRKFRANFKKGKFSLQDYEKEIETSIKDVIQKQEQIDLDVLVHGEFERNDMVEYFGEQLNGFLSTKNAWIQSYGSRCVKPPVIYGDVSRPKDMTVRWSSFAKKQTKKPIKGMLTGPITILQWSFVRNDQLRSETARQIAWSIRDELLALEGAGIGIIQIDEPALREGMPLKKKNWNKYLEWAIHVFKIASSGVKDSTQIHTHMCYSEFNDILEYIAKMDADVITIETSRSHMELLEAFSRFKYPNEIGPGVYDVHSTRIPSVEEISSLLDQATRLLPAKNIWVNPDCGLKTRKWPETIQSLKNMVSAAKKARREFINELPNKQ